uniref:Uncharacterized protein n=1 Tax=Arundo donax TaxID=35708 RepID=A0A0A9H3T1_ARUDO
MLDFAGAIRSTAWLLFTSRPRLPHAKTRPCPRCRCRTKPSAASSRTLAPFLPIACHHNRTLEHLGAPKPSLPSHLQDVAATTELVGDPQGSSPPVPGPNRQLPH